MKIKGRTTFDLTAFFMKTLLEKIRHELATESGLKAFDGACSGETITLDHKALIAEIDAALNELA